MFLGTFLANNVLLSGSKPKYGYWVISTDWLRPKSIVCELIKEIKESSYSSNLSDAKLKPKFD